VVVVVVVVVDEILAAGERTSGGSLGKVGVVCALESPTPGLSRSGF
jgi:hypothetical protein